MQNEECGMQNAKCGIQNTRCGMRRKNPSGINFAGPKGRYPGSRGRKASPLYISCKQADLSRASEDAGSTVVALHETKWGMTGDLAKDRKSGRAVLLHGRSGDPTTTAAEDCGPPERSGAPSPTGLASSATALSHGQGTAMAEVSKWIICRGCQPMQFSLENADSGGLGNGIGRAEGLESGRKHPSRSRTLRM